MIFNDREEAGQKLAEKLVQYRNSDALILAIPRGGVVIGKAIADALHLELDIYISRKIGAPGNPELAIGAVTLEDVLINEEVKTYAGADDAFIEEAVLRERGEIRRREDLFRKNRGPLSVKDRKIILADDGLATGYTAWAALQDLRKKRPAKLVLAIPVASPSVIDKLQPFTDEIICLQVPEDFWAVGQFYRNFPQIEDQEVGEILNRKGRF